MESLILETFFALSKCIRTSINNGCFFYEFHFKGVFRGGKIERIICKSHDKLGIQSGQEYYLKLYFISVDKTNLVGYVKKFIKLEEISY